MNNAPAPPGGPPFTPLTALKGVGDKVSSRLASLEVRRAQDLVLLLPRSYQDRSRPEAVSGLTPGTTATVRGQVLTLRARGFRRGGTLEMLVSDGTGLIVLKWFRHSRWLREGLSREYPPGTPILATGRVETYAGTLEMHHPDLARDGLGEGIVPIYPLTEGLNQNQMRRLTAQALDLCLADFPEFLPRELTDIMGLPSRREALLRLHRPEPGADVGDLISGRSPWHRRLRFEELFLFQAGLIIRRRSLDAGKSIPLPRPTRLEQSLLGSLPFFLTGAQNRCLDEIYADLARPSPMHRLLQGEVGSGKTLVAFLAMLAAASSGHQAALMVPTEILAEQHHRTLSEWGKAVGLDVDLLTGGVTERRRSEVLDAAARGTKSLFVGTHALVQESVAFSSLALAIVDEQHRFGVMQRVALRGKGTTPHLLVMTATPIPRSLAMALYGDLTVSTLDELPPGRSPVRTEILTEADRSRLHLAIAREVKAGRQVFIVYPLVEETQRSELMAAREMAEHYRTRVFPNLRIGLVTGRMSGEEKDKAMDGFRLGEYDVMVATTVIEVGVDVPNATLMVVEHAERFGLFQLHQLRGRVGRGTNPSSCLLVVGGEASEEARERLRVLTRTHSGFEVAEADLRMRGPGDFMGVRQSGWPDFRFAHPLRDSVLMEQAREAAESTFQEGFEPGPELSAALAELWSGRFGFAVSG